MSLTDNVIDIRRPVEFTIDGLTYRTSVRQLSAASLLVLAGVDPDAHELRELRAHHLHPIRYRQDDLVRVRRGDRYFTVADLAEGVFAR